MKLPPNVTHANSIDFNYLGTGQGRQWKIRMIPSRGVWRAEAIRFSSRDEKRGAEAGSLRALAELIADR